MDGSRGEPLGRCLRAWRDCPPDLTPNSTFRPISRARGLARFRWTLYPALATSIDPLGERAGRSVTAWPTVWSAGQPIRFRKSANEEQALTTFLRGGSLGQCEYLMRAGYSTFSSNRIAGP
jgi:hypothetical protein